MTKLRLNQAAKKAPFKGAFFIVLLLSSLLVACNEQPKPKNEQQGQSQPSTNAPVKGQQAKVRYVVDGDTINLSDETKVRLVGINTPELGHGERKDEPLAEEARKRLMALLKDKKVTLQTNDEPFDKHGRMLAHAYNSKGENVQQVLLQEGLAFAVAVADSLSQIEPYLQAEASARNQKRGIWSEPHYAPQQADRIYNSNVKGYRLIQGVVSKVSKSNKNMNLHLGEQFKVLIPRGNWKKYFTGKPKQYLNQTVTARGWVFRSHGNSGVKVYHPSMIEVDQ